MPVKVFFFADSCWDGSGDQYSGQCMAEIVERFQKFKMADGGHFENVPGHMYTKNHSTIKSNTSILTDFCTRSLILTSKIDLDHSLSKKMKILRTLIS